MHYHETVYGDLLYPPPPPYGYYIHIGFIEQSGVVQSIQVRGAIVRQTTPERFAQDWHRYSLDQVLTRYGQPSQVMLHLEPPIEAGSPAGYSLHVFYDQLGIAMSYLGLANGETMIQACPVFEQMTGIGLWLQACEEEFPLVEHVIAPDVMGYFRSLEEATGMSLETFYEIFRNPDSRVCLEGPPTFP